MLFAFWSRRAQKASFLAWAPPKQFSSNGSPPSKREPKLWHSWVKSHRQRGEAETPAWRPESALFGWLAGWLALAGWILSDPLRSSQIHSDPLRSS